MVLHELAARIASRLTVTYGNVALKEAQARILPDSRRQSFII